jgi:hypothetical protein
VSMVLHGDAESHTYHNYLTWACIQYIVNVGMLDIHFQHWEAVEASLSVRWRSTGIHVARQRQAADMHCDNGPYSRHYTAGTFKDMRQV